MRWGTDTPHTHRSQPLSPRARELRSYSHGTHVAECLPRSTLPPPREAQRRLAPNAAHPMLPAPAGVRAIDVALIMQGTGAYITLSGVHASVLTPRAR